MRAPKQRRTSLKELSAHLGLSAGTVSRALNDYSDISAGTRERVRKAAAELGYTANPLARRLAMGIAEAVAYLLPERHCSISEPFVAQLLAGLSEALVRRNWDLIVIPSVPSEDAPEMIDRLVTSGRVSGVVLSRPHKHDARIKLLQDARFPFIVHGRSVDHENHAWFDVDGTEAFVTAVDHLVGLGHSRIGFIGAPTYYMFGQMRLDGYRMAIRANGLPADDGLIQFTELSDDGGERAAHQLLAIDNPPTALVCATDTQAIGALAAIRSLGMTPGHEVSVIGYDGLQLGRHTNPPLTTMAQPQADSGRRLGEMLLSVIDGGDPKDFQELRSAELLRRKSAGPNISGPTVAKTKNRRKHP
ncbi:MAG: LacI family DNA-binding transcriptional regulator [Pseudomonadota bacterium]